MHVVMRPPLPAAAPPTRGRARSGTGSWLGPHSTLSGPRYTICQSSAFTCFAGPCGHLVAPAWQIATNAVILPAKQARRYRVQAQALALDEDLHKGDARALKDYRQQLVHHTQKNELELCEHDMS